MSSNWWANKLGTTPTNQPQQQQPRQFTTPPTQQPTQPYYPQEQIQDRRLPESATTINRCPGCGSGNYGSGAPGVRARCYDCGYPITQTGTGMPGVNVPTEGPTQAARQVSTVNNFNPQGIIGKIE
jgi:hypothetical protein